MKVLRNLSLLVLLAVNIAVDARGTEELVYGNSTSDRPDGGNGASANFTNQSIQALNFYTGLTSFVALNQGWVLLRNDAGGTVDFTVGIYANGANVPTGTALGITTMAVSNNGEDSWRNFVFSSPVVLSLNTTYWVVISAETTVDVNWLLPSPPSSTTYTAFNDSGWSPPSPLLRANSPNGGSSWNTGQPAEMGMQLSASTVPEPGAVGLLVIGLALGGWCLRGRLQFFRA